MSAERVTKAMRACLEYYGANETNPDRHQRPPYTWNTRQLNTALDRDWLCVGPGGWHILTPPGRAALSPAGDRSQGGS
jgi:hypothetical protein